MRGFPHRWLSLLLAPLWCMASAPATSADFPSRPIVIIVPFAAGGSSDVLARLIGQRLGENLGVSVVVENKPGAGATIGTGLVAKAAGDGYTALLADTAQTVAPAMYKSLPYDAVRDFKAAGMVGTSPAMLFAGPKSTATSVADLRAIARNDPAGLSIGTGAGTASHLTAELFQIQSGIPLNIVPYKGAAQAMTDVLSRNIDLIFTNPASASQNLKAGLIRAIGTSGAARDPGFPDTPTFREQGVDGMDVSYWFAVLLPATTPEAIRQRWAAELRRVLAAPDLTRKLVDLGLTLSDMTPEQVDQFLASDAAKWRQVVSTAGIKPE